MSQEKAAAGAGLGPTFRKVKAVHFSSSVPSGDSIRPTKQAFQISSTKSGEGMRCRAQRQCWKGSKLSPPKHSQTLNPLRRCQRAHAAPRSCTQSPAPGSEQGGTRHSKALLPQATLSRRTRCCFCTCILFTIISCSTSGWVSPVRFMVPSSSTTACTVGKPVLVSCSEWTESMVGMLGGRQQHSITGALQGQTFVSLLPTSFPGQAPDLHCHL